MAEQLTLVVNVTNANNATDYDPKSNMLQQGQWVAGFEPTQPLLAQSTVTWQASGKDVVGYVFLLATDPPNSAWVNVSLSLNSENGAEVSLTAPPWSSPSVGTPTRDGQTWTVDITFNNP